MDRQFKQLAIYLKLLLPKTSYLVPRNNQKQDTFKDPNDDDLVGLTQSSKKNSV